MIEIIIFRPTMKRALETWGLSEKRPKQTQKRSNQIHAEDYNEEIPDPLPKRRTAKRRVTGRYNGTVRSGYDEPFCSSFS